MEDSLKIICTYSGIFINDTIKASAPGYSSGSLDKIGSRYFLSNDKYYEFSQPGHFVEINVGESSKFGNTRKSIVYQDRLYIQRTLSITRIDSAGSWQIIHEGHEYLDMEIIKDELWFCTGEGKIFRYNGNEVNEAYNLDSRTSQIYWLRNNVYFSTDNGLFLLTLGSENPPVRINNLTDINGIISDVFNNLWISTDNGLFVTKDNSVEPIPYIENVEFNRGAIEQYESMLYFGSIDGIYIIDVHEAYKQHIPSLVDNRRVESSLSTIGIVLSILGIILFSGFSVFYLRRRKKVLSENDSLSLQDFEAVIRMSDISSVDVLADHYNTNPVQLNRIFKQFDTTPGKFLKMVKLKIAREMLNAGVPISEVSLKTGYSAGFIKRELRE